MKETIHYNDMFTEMRAERYTNVNNDGRTETCKTYYLKSRT